MSAILPAIVANTSPLGVASHNAFVELRCNLMSA
jgi:hypothetical protein